MSKNDKLGTDLDWNSVNAITSFEVPHTGNSSVGEELESLINATVSQLETVSVNGVVNEQKMYTIEGGDAYVLPVASTIFDGQLDPFAFRNRSGATVDINTQAGDQIQSLNGDVVSFQLEDGETVILYASSANSFGVYSAFGRVTIPPTPPLGNEYIFTALTSTDQNTPQPVFNFNTGILPAGDYDIEVTGGWSYTFGAREMMGELKVNGAGVGDFTLQPSNVADKGTFTLRRVLALSGVVPIEFNIWSTNIGDFSTVYDTTLTVTRRLP